MEFDSPADESEEWLNATTHALGLACSIAGAVIVLVVAARRGSPWEVWGCAVYAATLLATYAASTLSHLLRAPRLRIAFRAADQALIFLFIAGSYTPIALAWLRAPPWWVLHAMVWGGALFGFLSKAVFGHRVVLGTVSTVLYMVVGWLPMTAFWPMLHAVPRGMMEWLVAGGVCYTAGLGFFCYDDRIRYFHAVWHMLVVAGSTCHYLGILHYCTGTR